MSEDDSIEELCEKYIMAREKAVKWTDLISFVKRHKDMCDSDIIRVIMLSDDKLKSSQGYVYLADWGANSIQIKRRKHYDVSLYDAIYETINSSDDYFDVESLAEILENKYGDSVSRNKNSIRGTLVYLCSKEKIARIGANSGFYKKAQ